MLRSTTTPFAILGLLLVACGAPERGPGAAGHGHEEAEEHGPHGGRILHAGDFELELAIVERGIRAELRAWARRAGRPVAPAEVSLRVELARLTGAVEAIAFAPELDFLRGDRVVGEPHSFEVSVEAAHAGETYRWRYESFEGRTRIAPEVAARLGVETAIAGPAVLEETAIVYGRVRVDPERVRELRARFDGVVRSVSVGLGSVVAKGDRLLTIESNESLEAYAIRAPIAGVVTQRDANPGEQTRGRLLLTLTDPSSLWADLALFPSERTRVRTGQAVSIVPAGGGEAVRGAISTIEVLAREDQSVLARAVLPNPEGRLVPGTLVTAQVTVGEHEVPLAVRRTGIQTFRGSPVVYIQVGDAYEVRFVDLGRGGREQVEVLGGLEGGSRYVSASSYVIKADIEKASAAHDH